MPDRERKGVPEHTQVRCIERISPPPGVLLPILGTRKMRVSAAERREREVILTERETGWGGDEERNDRRGEGRGQRGDEGEREKLEGMGRGVAARKNEIIC